MRRLASLIALLMLGGCDTGSSTDLLPTSTAGTASSSGGSSGSPSAAGGGASAGTGSTTGGASTTPPKEEDFELLFRDDFDTLDPARWQLMTHSWDTNLALFSTKAALIEDGTMRITLTPAPEGTVDDSGKAKS